MKYTREQALTIVNFLDDFGIGSFVDGFKDGLREYRDGLEGVASRASDLDYRPIALSCYKAGVDAAKKPFEARPTAHADTQDDLVNIRDFRAPWTSPPFGGWPMGLFLYAAVGVVKGLAFQRDGACPSLASSVG